MRFLTTHKIKNDDWKSLAIPLMRPGLGITEPRNPGRLCSVLVLGLPAPSYQPGMDETTVATHHSGTWVSHGAEADLCRDISEERNLDKSNELFAGNLLVKTIDDKQNYWLLIPTRSFASHYSDELWVGVAQKQPTADHCVNWSPFSQFFSIIPIYLPQRESYSLRNDFSFPRGPIMYHHP